MHVHAFLAHVCCGLFLSLAAQSIHIHIHIHDTFLIGPRTVLAHFNRQSVWQWGHDRLAWLTPCANLLNVVDPIGIVDIAELGTTIETCLIGLVQRAIVLKALW